MTVFDDILKQQKGNFVKFTPLKSKDVKQEKIDKVRAQKINSSIFSQSFNPFGFLLRKRK